MILRFVHNIRNLFYALLLKIKQSYRLSVDVVQQLHRAIKRTIFFVVYDFVNQRLSVVGYAFVLLLCKPLVLSQIMKYKFLQTRKDHVPKFLISASGDMSALKKASETISSETLLFFESESMYSSSGL